MEHSFADLDEDLIKLAVALTIARLSKLEGPWYGPWDLSLNRRLGKINVKSDDGTKLLVPVIYPQYPVGITQGDLLDVEDNMGPRGHEIADIPSPTKARPISIWPSYDPPSSPSPNSAELPSSSPAALNRNLLTAIHTPLPSLLSVMTSIAGDGPPQTRPRTQDQHAASAALSPDDKEKLRAAYKIWSTRIPDFARCIYLIEGSDIVMMRWDLLVEIKKKLQRPNSEVQLLAFINVGEQVEGQAQHVFASNPNVDVIGGIMALGDVWIYQEYQRPKDLSDVGTNDPAWRPEKKGPDSDGSSVGSQTNQQTSDPMTSPGLAHNSIPPVPQDLREISVLGTSQSDGMLDMVGARLEVLNTAIWQGDQVNARTPSQNTLDFDMSNVFDEDDSLMVDLDGKYHHPKLGLYHPLDEKVLASLNLGNMEHVATGDVNADNLDKADDVNTDDGDTDDDVSMFWDE